VVFIFFSENITSDILQGCAVVTLTLLAFIGLLDNVAGNAVGGAAPAAGGGGVGGFLFGAAGEGFFIYSEKT